MDGQGGQDGLTGWASEASKMSMLWRRWFTAGFRQSVWLAGAVLLAYALDYLFNIAASRLLVAAELATVVALNSVGQIFVVASRVVQTVAARYTAAMSATTEVPLALPFFFQRALRLGVLGGTGAALALAALSRPLAAFLKIQDPWTVVALAAGVWFMAVRPVVGGVLQGRQQFGWLGWMQLTQAGLRLPFAILLIRAGWGALGALLALPLASAGALLLGLGAVRDVWLRGTWMGGMDRMNRMGRLPTGVAHYAAYTAAGLLGFALLVNMDVILARRFFDPTTAGLYGAAVILGRIVQFFPLAVIMIMFPKSAARQATERDPAGVLWPALLVVGLLCGGLTLAYYTLAPWIAAVSVGPNYPLDGALLGTVGLGMTLMALVNVWLNYFLALERPAYVWLIGLALLAQTLLMLTFHAQPIYLPLIIAGNGAWLTAAGAWLFWRDRRTPAVRSA